MLGLKPIKMLPARERVAAALRKAIISRQITEGEVLTLESTAQELGVSITPVREAFQILERDGLIDLQQNKGATVLGINETTLREHFQIRAALESEACVLCCKNRIDMSRIEQVLTVSKEMIEKQDYENYSKLNQSLHMEIWIAAGNEKLKKMLSSDEKITPKKWTAEKTKLEERLQESNPDYARVVTELASTEVIEHNRKMLAMTREAEQNQRSQIHSRKKNEQSL